MNREQGPVQRRQDREARAHSMNVSPVNCWVELFDWIEDGTWRQETDTGDIITHLAPPTGGGPACADEARGHRHHSCYCGKFDQMTAYTVHSTCGTCDQPIAGLQSRQHIGNRPPRQWVDGRNNVASGQPIWHEHSPTPQCPHCPHRAEVGHHRTAGYCTAYGCNCRQHPTPSTTF
ncbi:Uncharacterised protein [Mycobacteroides abscessus subsp. abscessus]|nr:Uncharacterised protein [Mycobacteroides abscessus subsp. abscessus]